MLMAQLTRLVLSSNVESTTKTGFVFHLYIFSRELLYRNTSKSGHLKQVYLVHIDDFPHLHHPYLVAAIAQAGVNGELPVVDDVGVLLLRPVVVGVVGLNDGKDGVVGRRSLSSGGAGVGRDVMWTFPVNRVSK